MDLEKLDKDFVLHSYNRNYVHFTSGKNAKLFTNELDYIDFTSGIGVASVGHGNEDLALAIYSQAQKLIHTSNLYLIEPQARLAQKLVTLSGYDMRCFFGNSGAEANEGAIKIARKYGQKDTKRHKIITIENSFHGRTISSLKATAQTPMHKDCFSPYPDGFVYAKDLQHAIDLIDDETIGVMIELIQGEGGMHTFTKKQVQDLCDYAHSKDVLVIVDEVQTGIWRTGKFLACHHYDINPDIITLAKGVAGGVPMGVVMTNKKDVFEFSDHGSTFGGNFLSSTAGLKTMQILETNEAHLQEMISLFENSLREILNSFSNLFTDLGGIGLMRSLELKDPKHQATITDLAFKERLLILRSGKNVLRFLPPLTITKEEIHEGFKRLNYALKNM